MAETVFAPTTIVSDRTWSVADLEQMPRGYRYEILDGVLYMAATPLWPHPGIARNLQDILSPWVRQRNLGAVLAAQTGVYLNDIRYVDPDLVYLRPDQIPLLGARPASATVAVEVLSPSNLRAPREQREALFVQAAVKEVWYIDFDQRSLEMRRLQEDGYETAALFRGNDTVTSAEFPGLEFPLTALWEDLGVDESR